MDEDDIDMNNQQDIPDDSSSQPQQEQPQQSGIDHAAIAQTVAQTLQQFQQSQPQPQRQMSPEELNQHFAVWNPDERFVNDLNKLTDAEVPFQERAQLLHGLRDGIMQQAFRAAQLLVEQQLGGLKQELAPVMSYAQEQQASRVMGEFHKKYPVLKGQEDLVDSITARLAAQGFKPKSKDEAFDKVAQIAEQVLKKANPQFVLKPSGGRNGTPPMAGTNMGGFGGSGGASGGGSPSGKRGGLAKIFQNA